jgi:hypothetical protein
MAEVTFTLQRVSDRDILEAIKNVAFERGILNIKLNLRLAKDQRFIQADFKTVESDTTLVSLFAANSTLIQEIRASADNWAANIRAIRTDKRADDLIVAFPNEWEPKDAAPLLISIRKYFRLFDVMENVEKVLGPEIADFYAKREEGLHRLEQLTRQIIEQNEDYRQKLDTQYEDRLQRLELEFEERRKLLESEIEKKDAEVAAKAEALAQKTQELDDRNSRHARRQLRQDFKKIIETRSTDSRLTSYTRRTRLPVHALYTLLVISFGALAVLALWEQINPPPKVWTLHIF